MITPDPPLTGDPRSTRSRAEAWLKTLADARQRWSDITLNEEIWKGETLVEELLATGDTERSRLQQEVDRLTQRAARLQAYVQHKNGCQVDKTWGLCSKGHAVQVYPPAVRAECDVCGVHFPIKRVCTCGLAALDGPGEQ